MTGVLQFLEKARFEVVLLVSGVVLILAAMFKYENNAFHSIPSSESPNNFLVIAGCILLLASLAIYAHLELVQKNKAQIKIEAKGGAISFCLEKTNFYIRFGGIENIANQIHSDAVVVLPSNEYFDDNCIADKNSSLGAYLQANYSNPEKSVKEKIDEYLRDYPTNEQEKEKGIFQKSYGIGVAVYFKELLNKPRPICFVSVTTVRAHEGIRARGVYIDTAINSVFDKLMGDRKSSICVPLLGSGHGGLKSEYSLYSMLIALFEISKSRTGNHLSNVDIVIYNGKANKLSESKVKKIIHFALDVSV
jgi:hypothetical protein